MPILRLGTLTSEPHFAPVIPGPMDGKFLQQTGGTKFGSQNGNFYCFFPLRGFGLIYWCSARAFNAHGEQFMGLSTLKLASSCKGTLP